jgi:hypothetical protein
MNPSLRFIKGFAGFYRASPMGVRQGFFGSLFGYSDIGMPLRSFKAWAQGFKRTNCVKWLCLAMGLLLCGVRANSAELGQTGGIEPGASGPSPTARECACAVAYGLVPTAPMLRVGLPTNPVVTALLRQAKAEAHAGRGEQAVATLERALAMEPRNPWLWHRLAVLQLQLGNSEQAVQLAKRSNALAAGQRRLMSGNWEVIALALERSGDKKGAAAARRRSRDYLSGSLRPSQQPGTRLERLANPALV